MGRNSIITEKVGFRVRLVDSPKKNYYMGNATYPLLKAALRILRTSLVGNSTAPADS